MKKVNLGRKVALRGQKFIKKVNLSRKVALRGQKFIKKVKLSSQEQPGAASSSQEQPNESTARRQLPELAFQDPRNWVKSARTP